MCSVRGCQCIHTAARCFSRSGDGLDSLNVPLWSVILLFSAEGKLSVEPTSLTVCPLLPLREAALSIVSALSPVNPPTDSAVQSECRAAVRFSATVMPSRTAGIFLYFSMYKVKENIDYMFIIWRLSRGILKDFWEYLLIDNNGYFRSSLQCKVNINSF